MSAIEILNSFNLTSERLNYSERVINDQYTAVEILDLSGKILFREYYYIVDTKKNLVYLADFKEPDAVFIAKIERGTVKAHATEPVSA